MLRRAALAGAEHALAAGTRSLVSRHPEFAPRVLLLVVSLLTGATGYAVNEWVDPDGQRAPAPAPIQEPTAAPDPVAQDICDDTLKQHIAHMAARGEALAHRLTEQGLPEYAEAIRDMTSVERLPDDLKLCVLLPRKKAQP